MTRAKHSGPEQPKTGRLAAWCGILLFGLALPAQALVVSVNMGWGYGQGWTAGNAEANLISGYNLQEGSIVQIIMYNSAYSSAPGPDADDNFDIWATYTGTGIAAEPYPGTEPSNVPGDNTVYDPYTVPAGHVIANTTQIGSAIYDPSGYYYFLYQQFVILGTWDSLYIRVFGATDFPNGEIVSSYWGLSTVYTGGGSLDYWPVGPVDDTIASNTNYFEVIPEPGTLALMALGGAGLLAGRRRRKSGSKP